MSDTHEDRSQLWGEPCQNCGDEVDTRTGMDVSVEVTVATPNERAEMVFCDLTCLREYFNVIG